MRTTLSVDEDVAGNLKLELRRSGRTFKETVNDLLRRGLAAKDKAPPRKRFVVHARDLGRLPGVEYDNIGDLLEQLDGPGRR